MRLEASDTGAAVRLVVGQALRVELDTSPASGYTWELEGDLPMGLQMETDPGARPPATVIPDPEAGTRQVWNFRALHPGQARLRFMYRRAWESTDQSARSAVFDVGVFQQP